MGYTVTAGFAPESKALIEKALGGSPVNKIPFGRGCSREDANLVMDYHITLIHWGKEYDSIYLPRLDRIKMVPCKVKITGTSIMQAEEGSFLLYFTVEPDEKFNELSAAVYAAAGLPVSSFLHITIDADKDYSKVQKLKKQIDSRMHFPFRVSVNSLNVYHVWKPVYLAKQII